MRRREFISLLRGAVLVWPLTARAQQQHRVRRIGVLMGLGASDPEGQRQLAAFERGLEDLGWAVGRNVQIDDRWHAGDPMEAQAFAKELSELHPDLLVAYGTSSVVALRQATRAIPIVFIALIDPVGQGFVPNLARPGGNITGFASFSDPSLAGKWLEMLKEIAPRVARVAIIFNPETAPYAQSFLRWIEAASSSFSVEPIASPVHSDSEIENVIAALASEDGGGLIVLPDTFLFAHRDLIIALAARHRVPTIYPTLYFAAGGGLLAYSIDRVDMFRRAASYVDRILKGANPGELPVQAPVKYELVINLKTAKTLGLTVPLSLLGRADGVIE